MVGPVQHTKEEGCVKACESESESEREVSLMFQNFKHHAWILY